MNIELYIKVDSIEAETREFNGYQYRHAKASVSGNESERFDILFPVETVPAAGKVIKVVNCKLVRINYESETIDVAVRVDKYEEAEDGVKASKHLTIPIIGMIIRSSNAKITLYGPDKVKFLMVSLQMKDADKRPFMLPIIGFNNKAVLLDTFKNTQIVTGFVTLKHKKQGAGYELALVSAELYSEY